MKKIIIILVAGFLLLLGSKAGAQFATPLDSSDVAGWKFTTFTDVDDSLTAGYQIYQKIDSTTSIRVAIHDSLDANWATFIAGDGNASEAEISESLHVARPWLDIADDGWIGLGAAAGRIRFADDATDTVEVATAAVKAGVVNVTQLNTVASVYAGNGLTVAAGAVTMTAATVNLPAGAVDATGEISAGIVKETHLDESGGAPSDNDVLTYNSGGANFTWVTTLPEANGGTGDTDLDDIVGGAAITVTDGANTIIAGNATVALTVNTVDSTFIMPDAILDSELGPDAVDEGNIADNGIDSEHYNDGSIDAEHLAADVIDETKIADDGIDSEHYNDGSMDLAHLAAGVYAKDIVTTAPLTGATDNVLVGADGDVTLAITVLKDLVTTAPVTGATDDIFPGADADITVALDFTASWDFGGAAGLEIPAVDDPTTDAEGEIAWDTNNDAIEVFMGDESESALVPVYQKLDALLYAPDGMADEVSIFRVDALLYPFGIEIDQVSITLNADAEYSMVFEEWSGDPPTAENDISTVTTAADDAYAEEAPDTDAAIDADDEIFLHIPATDVDWIRVQIIFHINDGN